jgi:hypothetical protein
MRGGQGQPADGVALRRAGAGRKCTETAGSFRNWTRGAQNDSGLERHGSILISMWRRHFRLRSTHFRRTQELWGAAKALRKQTVSNVPEESVNFGNGARESRVRIWCDNDFFSRNGTTASTNGVLLMKSGASLWVPDRRRRCRLVAGSES